MDTKEKCTLIVLAAGSGSRMKSKVAKQYMLLAGRPVLWYSLKAAEDSAIIDNCILVAGAEDLSYVKEEMVERYGFHKVSSIVAGGAERYDSVYHALLGLQKQSGEAGCEGGYVFIHDGARPLLTEEIIKRCYETVQTDRACVTGMPVKDTIKIVDEAGYAVQTPDRRSLWQVQTPQVFETGLITEAYEKMYRQKEKLTKQGIHITDDAMLVETFMDVSVKLVEGSYQNIKITTPEDIGVAETFLRTEKD